MTATVTVHFTIPIRFWNETHPIAPHATPGDWFDVDVLEATDTHEAETKARLLVNDRFGNHCWMSTYLDGPRWEDLKLKYTPGRCARTLQVVTT